MHLRTLFTLAPVCIVLVCLSFALGYSRGQTAAQRRWCEERMGTTDLRECEELRSSFGPL